MTEFAALFGKSKTWAYRRMYAGDIKVISGMGAYMVPVSEVDKVLRQSGTVGYRLKKRVTK